ncbi:MAG: DNA internalization-related competence protein ComEC/Rec2 [Peptoniphilaceae bacterium]|nr:DNA internalization-related competence protein ComEC/Rec2 [Peptoniphilaceae bacterium]
MRKNLLFTLLGILSGIGIFILDQNVGFYLILFSLILAFVFYLYDKVLMLLCIGIIFGFFYSSFTFSSLKLADKSNRLLDVTIVEKKQRDDYYTYTVKAKDIEDGCEEKSVFSSNDNYQISDKLLVKAKIKIPDKNTNPYLFSYRSYLLSKRIKSVLDIEHIYSKSKSKSILLGLKNSFSKYIYKLFDKNLSNDSSSFVKSVILGQSLIDNDDIKDLGLSHMLAVSGLHIDILVSFILLIFSCLNINYKYGFFTALSLCFFYGYLIGFPISVQRVLIMTTISFLAFNLKEPLDPKKSLLVAAIVILLINPFALLSSSYILSFAAATGIYVVYPKIKYYQRDSLIAKKAIFSFAIQLAIFPFLIFYYGKINLISIFANLVVVPIFELTIYLVFGIIILYPFFGKLLSLVFKILEFFIANILDVSKFLAYFKIFNIDFKKESILLYIFFFVLILVLLYGKKSNKLINKLYLGISIILVGFLTIEPIVFDKPTYAMVDIGQGDAFILKDGSDTYLIDLGGPKYNNYDSGKKILVPLLKAMGVKDIKAVFISHMDKDHAGNLDIIDDYFNIKSVISTALNEKDLAKYNFIAMQVGDRVKLKNGYIEAVFDGVDGEDTNNKALGLLINIKGTKILSLGDLESSYEDKLRLKADILKVSHHGSKNSTSKAFIEMLDPKVSLISAGRNNSYGHPHKEVLDNLKGRKIYNTQTDGFVEIRFSDNSYQIQPYLKGEFFQ